MTVAAVSMVRDEADIVECTVRHMASQVDFLIVADNGSTDGTRQILDQLSNEMPLTVIDDPEVGYFQSRKMTALADQARDQGAAWVVPFDADELWLARDGRRIADVLVELPEPVLIAEAALYDHVAAATDPDGAPAERMGWRRSDPAPLPKVACRALPGVTIHQGNHGVSYEDIHVPVRLAGALTVRHFPYRSPEQFVRKARNGAAAYAATDLDEPVGAHWRQYGQLLEAHGPQVLHDVFHKYFFSERPEADGLIYDPAP